MENKAKEYAQPFDQTGNIFAFASWLIFFGLYIFCCFYVY